jgi:probable phosphoglycerate mutase
MTARILLVRHGSHDRLGRVLCGRMEGVELNRMGQVQAQQLAALLIQQAPAAVHSSPMIRAVQTAEPIAEACRCPLQIEAALNEIDLGRWTGAYFDALTGDADWQRWNSDRLHHRPPDGESMLEAQVRVAAWLQRCAATNQTIVAVSHADIIKAACCYALGLSLDAHARFEIAPASVTTLIAGCWGCKIEGMNRVHPLA